MGLYAKAKSGHSQDFEPCPAGPQRLVCCDVVDLGMVDVLWQGKTKRQHKMQIRWQSEKTTKDGKPALLVQRYTLSMHEKATLRKILESWRGRPFGSDEEAEAFDIEKVIGANAYGNIMHSTKGDSTYANLASIMPLPPGMPKLAVKDYDRVKDRPGYVPPTPPTSPDADDLPSFDINSDLNQPLTDLPDDSDLVF